MLSSLANWLRRWTTRQASTTPRALAGQFVYSLPFLPGEQFWVVQGYGGAFSHIAEAHYSLDFGLPEDTPVCASRDGLVYLIVDHFVEGGTDPSLKSRGNAVYLLHNDDTLAAYVHLAFRGACVRPGDFVPAGQVIGLSGNTGYSSCPHLHFHVEGVADHRRIPTWFATAERGVTLLESGTAYSLPANHRHGKRRHPARDTNRTCASDTGEPSQVVYKPELLELGAEVVADLAAVGYEAPGDYSSLEAMHDLHGLEVCGIRDPQSAIEITRFLLRHFRGWNAGRIECPDESEGQGWVARIHRDPALVSESWGTG